MARLWAVLFIDDGRRSTQSSDPAGIFELVELVGNGTYGQVYKCTSHCLYWKQSSDFLGGSIVLICKVKATHPLHTALDRCEFTCMKTVCQLERLDLLLLSFIIKTDEGDVHCALLQWDTLLPSP
ncbi:hypothetical protein STEG23_003379 [Scotinomys teguina]